jgi:hypothetical protein
VGPNGEWLNWGGDKLWPAPQGWDGPNQWPGPPDAVLDGGPYEAAIAGHAGIRLTSRKDFRSGVRFSRIVRIDDESSIVRVHATMTNIDTKTRRWGIWTDTQLDASNRKGAGFNPELRAYIPLNRVGQFPAGYRLLFGDKENPQFSSDVGNNLLRIHYQRCVGKVGIDSRDGWVATVDGTTGYVFIQTFRFVPGADYPDGSSVEYWTNGLGKIFAWGKETVMPESVVENPYLVESELISPFARLAPGEQYDFDYEWRAVNIGANRPILACNEVGCTSEPLSVASTAGGHWRFSGCFGVFYWGEVRLSFTREDGSIIGEAPRMPVSPDTPLEVAKAFDRVKLPSGTKAAILSVFNRHGQRMGELGRTEIRQQ